MKYTISGIYCFENIIDWNKYAGQAQDIEERRKKHLYSLNSNNYNDSIYFQRAWKKYGAENFRFWIVEECPVELLDEREIFWIKELHSHFTECGYNLSWGGEAPMRGLNHTPETKQKLSDIWTEEKRRVFSETRIGHLVSDETRQKLSAVWTDAMRQKQSEKMANRIVSAETRQKLSEALSGENSPLFGKPRTPEQNQKLSLSQTGRKSANSTSVYYGVCIHTTNYVNGDLKWQARIRINGKQKRIGCFRKEIDAARAYNDYVIGHNLPNPLNIIPII